MLTDGAALKGLASLPLSWSPSLKAVATVWALIFLPPDQVNSVALSSDDKSLSPAL